MKKRIGTTLTELAVELGLSRDEVQEVIDQLEADKAIRWTGQMREGEEVFVATDTGRAEIGRTQ
jgi:DNA-binding FadR family transcriptional regulator